MDEDKELRLILPPQKMKHLEAVAREYDEKPEKIAKIWVLQRLDELNKTLIELKVQPTTENQYKRRALEGLLNPRGGGHDKRGLIYHEIILNKDTVTARPRAGDKITLVDIKGRRHQHRCTKKDTKKYTTIGQPVEINRWIHDNYHKFKVRKGRNKHKIYLEYTDDADVYRIYTKAQYTSRTHTYKGVAPTPTKP
jgi:hypothetical protein